MASDPPDRRFTYQKFYRTAYFNYGGVPKHVTEGKLLICNPGTEGGESS